jgi:hypothetical protein
MTENRKLPKIEIMKLCKLETMKRLSAEGQVA